MDETKQKECKLLSTNEEGEKPDDISKKFPNFSLLTPEERQVFFEALTTARKNVEKKGVPMRERFGTIHDKYLDHYDQNGKKENSQPTPFSSNFALLSPSNTLFCLQAGDSSQKGSSEDGPTSPNLSSNLSETNRDGSVSETLEIAASEEHQNVNRVSHTYPEKEKKVKQISINKILKNDGIKSRDEQKEEIAAPTATNTPQFDALNSEEKTLFFKVLGEARSNVVKKNPEKGNEILQMNSIVGLYQKQAHQELRKRERGKYSKTNLKVNVTLKSGDNERLEKEKSREALSNELIEYFEAAQPKFTVEETKKEDQPHECVCGSKLRVANESTFVRGKQSMTELTCEEKSETKEKKEKKDKLSFTYCKNEMEKPDSKQMKKKTSKEETKKKRKPKGECEEERTDQCSKKLAKEKECREEEATMEEPKEEERECKKEEAETEEPEKEETKEEECKEEDVKRKRSVTIEAKGEECEMLTKEQFEIGSSKSIHESMEVCSEMKQINQTKTCESKKEDLIKEEDTWETQCSCPTPCGVREKKSCEKKKKTIPSDVCTTTKVMLVDDNVIEKLRGLIYYLEQKVRNNGCLEKEYLKLLVDYIDYLSRALESLLPNPHQVHAFPAEVHLQFNENQKKKGEKKLEEKEAEEEKMNKRMPRSVSDEGLGMNVFVDVSKDNIKEAPTEKKSDPDLASLNSETSWDSEDLSFVPPSATSKKTVSTKIRLLQDLLEQRAEFVEGNAERFKIVYHPEKEYVPEDKEPTVKFINEEKERYKEGRRKRNFLKVLIACFTCGRKAKKEEESGIFENLKGEAVRVDVTEGKKDPANATLNQSMMEVLKAAGRKRIIEKYYSKE